MSLATRTPARLMAPLAAGAAALVLAGCSVAYDPPAPPPASSPSSLGAPDETVPVTRAAYAGLADRTLSCPEGSLQIDAVGDVIALDGDCDTIEVSGTGTVVLARGVGDLQVTGVSNVVIVATADTIDVSGTANRIVWESGTPTVADTGTASRLGPSEGE